MNNVNKWGNRENNIKNFNCFNYRPCIHNDNRMRHQARTEVFRISYGLFSRLSENTFDALTLGYEKDGVDWGAYDKIMLEQVVLFLDENAEYKGVDPEDLAELTRYFYDIKW